MTVLLRAGRRLRAAWETVVCGSFLAGVVVDLTTRRRVKALEERVETLELERQFDRDTVTLSSRIKTTDA